MEIPKPTDADKERFRSLVPDAAGVEVKPMFGNFAAFVNGNMFMGLFGPDIGVRLDDEGRAELRQEPDTGDFGPADRPMKEYVALPSRWLDNPAEVATWIDRALSHTAAMPPKQKKRKS